MKKGEKLLRIVPLLEGKVLPCNRGIENMERCFVFVHYDFKYKFLAFATVLKIQYTQLKHIAYYANLNA